MPQHTRPLCPHCGETIMQLAVWIDDAKRSALFFCPHCGKAFGAQLLPEGLPDAAPRQAR
jgi:predicted RNA-binding Zn-ribbon protein involved in translation (DUF1610 family)